MDTEPTKPWWDQLPDDLTQMAKMLCASSTSATINIMVHRVPNPWMVQTPRGLVAAVRTGDIVPVWTTFIPLAEVALATAKEIAAARSV